MKQNDLAADRRNLMEAVEILGIACYEVSSDLVMTHLQRISASSCLHHAIMHLARPDRDTYPKTRKGTKRRPVTRD